MSNKLTTTEKVIEHLNSKFNAPNNNTNEIKISKKDVDKLNIPENELSKLLMAMETSGYFKIKDKSVHNNFNKVWIIALTDSCIYYFENKKLSAKSVLISWIQFLIPTVISIIALFSSQS